MSTTLELETTELDQNDDFQDILDRLADCDQAQVARIQGQYALVKVGISRWRGDYKVKKSEIFYDGEDLTAKKLLSKPYWHLMPPEWKQRFEAVEQQKNEILAAYSVPSGELDGVRIVMADKLEDCCSRLSALESRFLELADDFCSKDNRQKILDYLQLELNDVPRAYKEAIKHVPDQEHLRKTFSMKRIVIPTALPQWAIDDQDSFHAQELQRSERRMLASNLTTMVQKPREHLAEVLGSMIDQLTEPDNDGTPRAKAKRRLSRDTVDAARRELSNFLNFDDVIEDDLVRQLKKLDEHLGGLRQDLENDTDNKVPLRINTDNQLATTWSDRLSKARVELLAKESMLAGLKKMCGNAGVVI